MTAYIYVTSDGNGHDYRGAVVLASGLGEAGNLAYGIAEDRDRELIAVISEAEWTPFLEQAADVRITSC